MRANKQIKKYRLLKDLPGVKAGAESEIDKYGYFEFSDSCCFDMKDIKANPDFFQLIEEPNILLVTEDGVEIKFGDELWWIGPENIPKYEIWEEWKMVNFDYYKKWIISGYRFFSTEKAALDYIESQKPKIVFTTEDGYEVKEGESIELIGIFRNDVIKKPANLIFSPTNTKWFKDKDKAREYLGDNYPFFSKKEIQVWISDDKDERTLDKLAEEKAKQIIP